MKNYYEKPELEIISFTAEEIMDIVDGSMGTGENPFPEDEED